jgi:hypothetical protein
MFKLRTIIILFLVAFAYQNSFSQSETHRLQAPTTDYPVTGIVNSNGYSLLRGYFYRAGAYSGSGIILNQTNGTEDLTWPKISGDVNAVISDGSGGWYVGGYLYAVDNIDIGNLIHILSDKTVDRTWNPNPLGSVSCLSLKDGILYIGGYFQSVAGQTRNYAAAFNTSTGALTEWNPGPDGYVNVIEGGENAVYLAGAFANVNNGASVRNKIAAVNKMDGSVLPGWNITLTGFSPTVYDLAATSTKLYVAGNFTQVNGVSRSGLAALSPTDGAVDVTWNPNPQHSGTPVVRSIALSGNTLYAGGVFNNGLGGLPTVHHLGAVSATGTGAGINSFMPVLDENDQISKVEIQGATLYASGFFNSVNGLNRQSIAGINTNDGIPTPWAPEPDGSIYAIASDANKVFIGGDLRGINWKIYNGIAIVEESTGKLWPYELQLETGDDIQTMVVKENIMYVGGKFNTINGVPRKNLAAIDLENGDVLPWNPGASGTTSSFDNTSVAAMNIKDNTIYIGGIFLTAGGQSRPGLAAIDATTGAATNWNPIIGDGTTTNEYPLSLDIENNTLYVAGDFTKIAGQTRPYIGAIDLTTGSLLNWNPVVLSEIWKVRVGGNAAYVLGDFSDGVAGAIRTNGIAAIDLTSGLATDFDPQINSPYVSDLALTETDVYIGGYFSVAELEDRPGLASYSLATGTLNPWMPDLGGSGESGYDVEALAASTSRLFVGGAFVFIGRETRSNYTEYDLCSTTAAVTLNGSFLTASPGSAYQWYENDVLVEGAISQSYEINVFEYGRYAVEVTSNGCTVRSNDYIYLVTDNENELPSAIKLYPNPVEDELFIEVPSSSILSVHDVTGNPVNIVNLKFQERNRIETSSWTKGVYVLKIKSNQSVQSFKIIKTN